MIRQIVQCTAVIELTQEHLPYSGLFSKGFIFRYFEEAFSCKNKFPGPAVLFRNKFSRLNKMLVCTHVITLSLQHECVL